MELSCEKVSAQLQPATAGHAAPGHARPVFPLKSVQSGWSGCLTGNRKKLSSSQAQLDQAIYRADGVDGPQEMEIN